MAEPVLLVRGLWLRYVESNPVRAGLVGAPAEYPWSSARAHLVGPGSEAIPVIDWEYWENVGGASWWQQWISEGEDTRDVVAVRRATYAGQPLGSSEYVAQAESRFGRQWSRRGRAVVEETGTERSASVACGG